MTPLPKSVLATGKFLTLVKAGRWEYVERVRVTGVAVIIAVTQERKLLLVEQYRTPVAARTIELPAGLVGDESEKHSESASEAARRELLEETGYQAGEIKLVARGPISAGLTSEIITVLRADRLVRVGPGGGIAHEDITVHEVPLSEVTDWLNRKAQAGVMIDLKVYAGLHLLGGIS